jgi:predicted ArsR family transcriptional regulator
MTAPPARAKAIRLTDPRALRAYAHPIRLALVGALRTQGPLTATRAGSLVGQSPASCSFHFRQLAKYGVVEDAGGGRGRERRWRATALYTGLPRVPRSPEQAGAARLLYRVLAERYFDQVLRWIAARDAEPRAWQKAAQFGDDILYLTAKELSNLKRQITALLAAYRPRTANAAYRPAGARRVTVLRLAFPEPGAGRRTSHPRRPRHRR